jgi:uncharacterized membrane protein YqiK
MEYILANRQWLVAAVVVVLLLLLYRQVLRLFGVIMVPDDGIGVATKKFVLLGKHRRLPDGRIIALNGEPTIGNYFRNAAQGSDIIDFLKNRSVRQGEARAAISAALTEYNVGAVDTLIGDIVPPDELMKTLTDRKLAEQERVTYDTQRLAQVVRQQLEQATALAVTQSKVVDAERQVAIAEFNAQASVKSAEGQAQAKKINAEADATVVRTVGDADASKTRAVGSAEAEVMKLKIASMESGNYAMVQVAEALAKSGVKLVPDIIAGASGSGGTLVDVLLANLIRDSASRPRP